MAKINTNFDYENRYKTQGFKFIAGVDEVGRGAWAGPVFAGAVILPHYIDGVYDSKLLNAQRRQELAGLIKQNAVSWSVGRAELEEIDQVGVHKATFLAFKRAIEGLENVDFVLSDAFFIPDINISQLPIKKGDQISNSIAAASIIAKVERDELMIELSQKYSGYGFDKNKGYGTKFHIECLDKYGPCEIHRKGYKSISRYL